MNKIYIHYGHSSFDPNQFIDVGNNPDDLCDGRKPHSGLWGTDIESKHSWKEAILSDNETAEKEGWRLSKYFKFTLKETSNIMTLKNENDFISLFMPYFISFKQDFTKIPILNYVVNWRKLAKNYDAIEAYTGSNEILKSALYGWDCDSICVFHKEVIVLL